MNSTKSGNINWKESVELGAPGSVNRNGVDNACLKCFTGTNVSVSSVGKDVIQFEGLGMLPVNILGYDKIQATKYTMAVLYGIQGRLGSLDERVKLAIVCLPFVPATRQTSNGELVADTWQNRLTVYIHRNEDKNLLEGLLAKREKE